MKDKLSIQDLAPYLPYGILLWDGEHEHDLIPSDDRSVQDYKLLLYPISAVTKKIVHNGAEFVPALILWQTSNAEEEEFDLYGTIPADWQRAIRVLQTTPGYLPYREVIKLLSWHFDVFGLIDNGLAVDKTKRL